MIHQFKLNGYNRVLDVCSGSVNVVDDVAYRIIQLFCAKKDGGLCEIEGHPSELEKSEIVEAIIREFASIESLTNEEVRGVVEDVGDLVRNKILFTPDIYREKLAKTAKNTDVIKALCLHVAHTCNLDCEYCFAAQGKFHGDSALMSLEVARNG